MLALVENLRRKQLAWFDAVLLHRNWNMSQLAVEAKVNPSTLSKFKADPENIKQLSTRTVAAIEAVGGIAAYNVAPPKAQRGLGEEEAEPIFSPAKTNPLHAVIAAAKGDRNGLDAWILTSKALDLAGYLQGDVLMVDQNAEAKAGDVVLAQVLADPNNPKTVFRIFEDPYLIASSSDPALLRPMHIGRDPVLLRGVVVSTLRSRRVA